MDFSRPLVPVVVIGVAGAVAPACVDDSSTGTFPDPDASLSLDAGLDTRSDPDADSAPGPDSTLGVDADTEPSCVPLSGSAVPTLHSQTVAANEIWTAAGSPHVVTFDVAVSAAATLTIEPCAEVRIDAARTLTVQGRLVAEGTAKRPIKIVPSDPTKKWGTIRTFGGAEVRLAHATLEGGGNVPASLPHLAAALSIRGDVVPAPQPILFVDTVTIKDSAAMGVMIVEGGAFAPGSTGLTITSSGFYPLKSAARSAGTIPVGVYTGNTNDAIILTGDNVQEDVTFHDRGVPYHVGDPGGTGSFGRIRVAPLSGTFVPLLTIEPGVTMKFLKNVSTNSALLIGSNTAAAPATGALFAVGTAAKPIVFTSAEAAPAAGDWLGLFFSQIDSRSKIDHAKVEFAGGPSGASNFSCSTVGGDIGSILLLGGMPATPMVTNTTIESSLGDGIGRGWQGAEVDFLPSNTFTNVARCKQSFPRPSVGGCPSTVPCP